MRYPRPTQAQSPPPNPVLVIDGGCPFCRASARLVQRLSRRPLGVVPLDEIEGRGWLTQLGESQRRESAHFIAEDGTEYHGGAAMTRAMRLLPGGRAAALLDLPLIARVRDLAYAAVSRARHWVAPLFP